MGIGPFADQMTTWYDEYLLETTTGPAVNTNTTMSCKIYKYKDVAPWKAIVATFNHE